MPIRTFTDLDLNFTNHPISGDVSRNVGNIAVIRAIENLVLMGHYETPFQPDVGSNVYKLLFENLSDLTGNALAKEIMNTIKNFEPRASIHFINVEPNINEDGYDIRLEFFIEGTTEPIAVAFFLERIN